MQRRLHEKRLLRSVGPELKLNTRMSNDTQTKAAQILALTTIHSNDICAAWHWSINNLQQSVIAHCAVTSRPTLTLVVII
jgi:hypothetical protein